MWKGWKKARIGALYTEGVELLAVSSYVKREFEMYLESMTPLSVVLET